jgi:hypothetical protein
MSLASSRAPFTTLLSIRRREPQWGAGRSRSFAAERPHTPFSAGHQRGRHVLLFRRSLKSARASSTPYRGYWLTIRCHTTTTSFFFQVRVCTRTLGTVSQLSSRPSPMWATLKTCFAGLTRCAEESRAPHHHFIVIIRDKNLIMHAASFSSSICLSF